MSIKLPIYVVPIYTAPCVMILIWGLDITWAIGRVVLKVLPVLGPGIALGYLGPKMALGWRLVPFNGPKYARAIPGPKTGETFNTTLPNGPSNAKPPNQNHYARGRINTT